MESSTNRKVDYSIQEIQKDRVYNLPKSHHKTPETILLLFFFSYFRNTFPEFLKLVISNDVRQGLLTP